MSLQLQVNQQIGLLNWNFEELNAELDVQLKSFTDVVITEEQITEAKKARANLNSLSKAINDRKIQIKKEFCAPYLTFESEVKTLLGKIDKASSGIDQQVKAFEEAEKKKKEESIKEFFKSTEFTLVPFESLFDPKWLNKSCTEKQWKEQLSSKVENIKVELSIINNMEVSNKEELKEIYLSCLNIKVAIDEYEKREARRAQLKAMEYQRKQDEERLAKSLNNSEYAQKQTVSKPDVHVEELYTRTFRVIDCTRQQIIDLGNYMNAHGIRFEKVEVR